MWCSVFFYVEQITSIGFDGYYYHYMGFLEWDHITNNMTVQCHDSLTYQLDITQVYYDARNNNPQIQ